MNYYSLFSRKNDNWVSWFDVKTVVYTETIYQAAVITGDLDARAAAKDLNEKFNADIYLFSRPEKM